MTITIEITDVQPLGVQLTFKSEITDKGITDLNDWKMAFTALVSYLTDLGINQEQMHDVVDNFGESFRIDKEYCNENV